LWAVAGRLVIDPDRAMARAKANVDKVALVHDGTRAGDYSQGWAELLASDVDAVERSQLEHVLWAAATIAEDPTVLVIGSQSILGTAGEQQLPALATASMEVDVAFFDDATNEKSDRVDGAIGQLSPFHEEYGYYAQGGNGSRRWAPLFAGGLEGRALGPCGCRYP
jgi:hypothetical protein